MIQEAPSRIEANRLCCLLQSIADVAEALAGAIGKLKEHELILQTCMRLFPSSFPSPIAWRDISQTSASPDYGRIVASADAVATFANITGYSFNNPYLLGLTLVSAVHPASSRVFKFNDLTPRPM